MSVRTVVAFGALLRLLAVVGITPTVYVDSVEYRGVALLGGHRRPWTVPALHALVGDGAARVVAHALLGAAAWAALALAVSEVLRHPALRVVTAACVMTIGLVGPVASYDTTITSESVAISLAVLLLATGLRLAGEPSVARAIAFLVVAVPFTFTRNDHPLLVTTVALAVSYVAVRSGAPAWRLAAVGLLVISVWGWYAVGRNDEIERFNLALVLANRVLPDADATAWFTDHGMPLPRGVRPVVGLVGGDTVLAFADDPGWNRWAAESGRSTYGRFLLTHPGRFLLDPWPDLFGLRSTTLETAPPPVVLLAPGDRYGRLHPMVPDPVEAVLWGGGTAAPVVLGGGALAMEAMRRRRGLLARLGPTRVVAGGVLLVACGHLVLVWHASPLELGRLAMVPATLIHAALLVTAAVTADNRLQHRTRG